uniref:Uncharacterized protein n=1 Tax=Podarcis muralis TaxID=64176 RepID=A0A670I352_PODMU
MLFIALPASNSIEFYGTCCLVSTPGTPVFHCLPQFGQTHAGSFENTVQPSRPLVFRPINYDREKCVAMFHKRSCSIRVVNKTDPAKRCEVFAGVG